MSTPRLVLIAILAWALVITSKFARRISDAIAFRVWTGPDHPGKPAPEPAARKPTLIVDNHPPK